MADAKSTQDKLAKDKILRLTKYLEGVKSRLSTGIPERHKNRQEAYKAHLKLEIKRTTKKIESLRGT
jgi:hypothetical protein